MGIPFERQELGNEVVTDGWNILARVPGRSGKKPFLFVFHLDTAAPSNHVEVRIEDGCVRSIGNSVLGADGKLAIAVVMDSRIESEEAIVIDHYVTGEVLMRTPARLYLNVELIGRAAHVIRNEEPGINALLTAVEIIHQIPVGRISDNLSINVFDLVSLSPSNAVPKYARFDVEIRCFGNDIKKKIRNEIRQKTEETAERMGCKCNIREEEDVPETDFSENKDMLERLDSIYRKSGLSMTPARSFGVLDATCTNQLGIRTVPIGFNIYHSHSAREYVVIEDVKKMLELVENIIRYF